MLRAHVSRFLSAATIVRYQEFDTEVPQSPSRAPSLQADLRHTGAL